MIDLLFVAKILYQSETDLEIVREEPKLRTRTPAPAHTRTRAHTHTHTHTEYHFMSCFLRKFRNKTKNSLLRGKFYTTSTSLTFEYRKRFWKLGIAKYTPS